VDVHQRAFVDGAFCARRRQQSGEFLRRTDQKNENAVIDGVQCALQEGRRSKISTHGVDGKAI
jgi:hypothetical protein